MEFSLDAMGKRIALDAPALSSFLDGICNEWKPDDRDKDVDNEGEEIRRMIQKASWRLGQRQGEKSVWRNCGRL